MTHHHFQPLTKLIQTGCFPRDSNGDQLSSVQRHTASETNGHGSGQSASSASLCDTGRPAN